MMEVVREFNKYILLAAIGLSVFAGCGGGVEGPPRASVSGKLTIDGNPVPDVEVHFQNPEFPNHGSFAVTDSDGNFRLVQGAAIGLNKVYFSKVEGGEISSDPESGMDAGQFEAMSMGNPDLEALGPKQIVPAAYTAAASKLTFDVPAGGTKSANFEL